MRHFKQSTSRVNKAADVLLKEAGLTEAENKVLLKIKIRHESGLKYFSQKRTVTIDAFKETMLGFGPSTLPNIRFNYLTFPEFIAEWEKEYIASVWQLLIKKPKSRPKKIIENAILIVIFNLLKREDRQIKWLYLLTTDIVKQCFNKKIGPKAVENALHST